MSSGGFKLAHRIVATPAAEPTKAVLFLHGVFGRGRNFGALARRLTDVRRDLAAVLVDLRMHGDTGPVDGPHTLDAAAADLDSVIAALVPRRIVAVVGHSLGGKVALAFARRHPGAGRRTLVLDITPGARPEALRGDGGRSSPLRVLEALRPLAAPGRVFDDRQDFVDLVMASGQSVSTARWLATNLERVAPDGAAGPGGYRLAMDLDGIQQLLKDHYQTDLWPVARETDCRFLLAGRSDAGGARDRSLLLADTATDVELLPEADHWLHRERPEAVLDWLERHLP